MAATPSDTTVSYLVMGGGVDHFDLLPPPAVEFWSTIQKEVSRRFEIGSEHEKWRMRQVSGCLDKLSASLMQVSRLRDHERSLLRTACAQLQSGSSLALRAAPMLADFESLLLQGRAALDRLTWLLAKEFKNSCSSYRKLRPILKQARDNPVAVQILAVYEVVIPWFDALFGKFLSDDSLRDLVGHKNALTENVEVSLAAYSHSTGRVLLLDCEVKLPGGPRFFPIIKSARDSVGRLSTAVLGGLAPLLDIPPGEYDGFDSTWRPSTVPLSDFLVGEPDNSPMTEHNLTYLRRMTPSGFDAARRNVKPDLFASAVSCE